MTTNAKELFSGGIPLSHSCLIVATTGAHVAVTLEYLQDFERAVRVEAMNELLGVWSSSLSPHEYSDMSQHISKLESQQPT